MQQLITPNLGGIIYRFGSHYPHTASNSDEYMEDFSSDMHRMDSPHRNVTS